MPVNVEKAIKYWPKMSVDDQKKLVSRMRRGPADPVFEEFISSQPPEVLDKLFKMTELPLDAEGRSFVKNFANDPEGSMAYLKEHNKDIRNIRWRNGRIVGQRDGEDFDRVLDPAASEWTDTLNDVADVWYDALDMVTTGLATVGGAKGGGIPGAMASGATASGVSEYGRQKIGQMGGIPQDIDAQRVGVAAGLGGVGGAGGLAKAATKPMAQLVKQYGPKVAESVGSAIGGTVGGLASGLYLSKKGGEYGAKIANKLFGKGVERSAGDIGMKAMGMVQKGKVSKALASPYGGMLPQAAYQGGTEVAEDIMANSRNKPR